MGPCIRCVSENHEALPINFPVMCFVRSHNTKLPIYWKYLLKIHIAKNYIFKDVANKYNTLIH